MSVLTVMNWAIAVVFMYLYLRTKEPVFGAICLGNYMAFMV